MAEQSTATVRALVREEVEMLTRRPAVAVSLGRAQLSVQLATTTGKEAAEHQLKSDAPTAERPEERGRESPLPLPLALFVNAVVLSRGLTVELEGMAQVPLLQRRRRGEKRGDEGSKTKGAVEADD